MDITILFKACVKTVQTTNKSLGIKNQKTNLLKVPKRDANLKTAKDIIKQITNLNNLLIENKAAYLNVLNYLSTNKTMSEFDRGQIDKNAENIINTCNNLINNYKKELNQLPKSKQYEEHYNNVIDSLERYLKSVSKVYTEAKAIRVKRVIETHKLSKLETTINNNNNNNNNNNKNKHNKNNSPVINDKNNSTTLSSSTVTTTTPVENIENILSTEEIQIFESENELLYNELNALSDEVKQMESKVVHIAELQELFTEKVLQQEQDIERISNTVVGATGNMKDANEQIRQSIQRNAGLRVWILFFLVVMSFSLLFLDWYND